MSLREVPFFRLILPFLIGILVAIQCNYILPSPLVIGSILLSLAVVIGYQKAAYNWRWLYGFTINTCLFLIGFQVTQYNNHLHRNQHFSSHLSDSNLIIGTVADMPTTKKSHRVLLDLEWIGPNADSLQACQGKTLLYIAQDSTHKIPQYGDRIMIHAKLRAIAPPSNPYQFDYQRYLHFQNIHHQGFIQSSAWQLLAQNKGNATLALTYGLRKRFLQTLRKHLTSEDELAVGSALILGYKNELSEEVKEAYKNTGAMHVLAVSGLHVGLIAWLLHLLFGLFKSQHIAWKWTRPILIIFSLWFFALLTGSSASVLRAATMFSFLVVGQSLKRYTNIYNTLACSAFFLLCWNPYLLMHVGFQLSYAAVLGIVYFQPKIYRLMMVNNPVLDWFWQLTAVSIAAQLATMPISLYYFHQLPTLFWLSSMIVIPAATVILPLGLLLLFLEMTIPYLAHFVGILLHYILLLTNQLIFFLQGFPFAVIHGIWLGVWGFVLLFALLITLIWIIERPKTRQLLFAINLMAILAVSFAFKGVQSLQQRQIVIYNLYRHSVINCIEGKTVTSLTDTILNQKNLSFATENHMLALGVEQVKRQYFPDTIRQNNLLYQNGYLQFYDKTIAIIHEPFKDTNEAILSVDYVLIRNNPRLEMKDLAARFECKEIIFDGSNKTWRIDKWLTDCELLGLNCYDASREGAWIYEFGGR